MTNNRISVFLPTRKGSQRVKNKNTRKFANINGGLLELKINQLLKVISIDEIILSTNDDASIEVANKILKGSESKLKIISRPDELAQDTTELSELIKYVPSICSCPNILWTHVTSPFVDGDDYEQAIRNYREALENGFDSLMSGSLFKNFLWDAKKKDIINRQDNSKRWPRTQDLHDLFEIDSAIFIANKRIYHEINDRVGENPFLYIQEGIKSLDVDWEHDFELAEFIYKTRSSTLEKNS